MTLTAMSVTGRPTAVAIVKDAQLVTGDVLLMLGTGEVSKLIAWGSDALYSHAAVVADPGYIIEATTKGVQRNSIADRLVDHVRFVLVDAIHSLARDGSELTTADRAAVLATAQTMLNRPYPLDKLAEFGLIVTIRQKLPKNPLARFVVREALDHLVKQDPQRVVCSEVVYRSLAECSVTPSGRLAPEIVLEAPTNEPLGPFNWLALLEEVVELTHPERKAAVAAAADAVRSTVDAANASGNLQASPPTPEFNVSDDELRSKVAAARDAFGVDESLPTTAADDGTLLHEARDEGPKLIPIPNPNPKLITPGDLAASPTHRDIGRLMQS
jgi:hypothetical protein